jgi:hypothetical protein
MAARLGRSRRGAGAGSFRGVGWSTERRRDLKEAAGRRFPGEVDFLVPTGRARPEDVASAEEFERVFQRSVTCSRLEPGSSASEPQESAERAGGGEDALRVAV